MTGAGAHIDAFGLLGLPPRFDLDSKIIEDAFFARTKESHPDRFQGSERVAALSRTRALNDAYQTLKKPVARAEYMLARAGVQIGDNERLDPAFLMEVLELREQLAEHRSDRTVVERLQQDMRGRRDAAVASLEPLFANHDLAGIKAQLMTLRYLDRYLAECDAALDED
jgi:molecular chaperone HscB